jgi:hypothetical protein
MFGAYLPVDVFDVSASKAHLMRHATNDVLLLCRGCH